MCRRGWVVVVIAVALELGGAGCLKDNPGWHESLGEAGSATTSDASTGDTTLGPTTSVGTTGTTAAGTTTVGSDASSDPTTTTSPITDSSGDATTDPSTTSTSDATTTTVGDTDTDTGTTGDPPPVCGHAATGEALMVARRFINNVEQGCGDLEGRHYVITGIAEDLVTAMGCSPDPKLGCTGCNQQDTLAFNVVTPVPDGVLATAPCVYLAAFEGAKEDANAPCRYKQMAIWHTGDLMPTAKPPEAILGHGTTTVANTVTKIHGGSLKVAPEALPGPCSCVDANDCCPDNATEYRLWMVGANETKVAPGEDGPLTYADAEFTAYNGNSQETGACVLEQQIDWWMLRP
jgi:hypothetical protein